MTEPDNESAEFILSSIQKINHSIKRIVKYFSMCCLYEFNIENKKWNKLGMEGPCFIYETNGLTHNMLILAQKSMKKMDLCIETEWKLEKHEEKSMLIFKATDKQIRSLHFANTEQMTQCYNMIFNYISGLKNKEQK